MTVISDLSAWRTYRGLSADDRRVVDAWLNLGNDLPTSLLNSRVVNSRYRRRPTGDELNAWSRLTARADQDLMLQNSCEHEAAHAITATALGLPVLEVSVSDDGLTGVTLFEQQGTRGAAAIVAAAAEVWIREFRAPVFASGERAFRGFSDDLRVLMEFTNDEDEIRNARRRAADILEIRHADVLRLARDLARDRRIVHDPAAPVHDPAVTQQWQPPSARSQRTHEDAELWRKARAIAKAYREQPDTWENRLQRLRPGERMEMFDGWVQLTYDGSELVLHGEGVRTFFRAQSKLGNLAWLAGSA